MKRAILGFVLVLVSVSIWAQQPQPLQGPAEVSGAMTGQRHAPERWRYDPAAPRPGTPGAANAGCSAGLQKINPDDINYGGLLSLWHLAMVQETFENWLWWLQTVTFAGLLLSLGYNYFLVDQRDKRLMISADVLALVWNAYVHSRSKAIGMIKQYNEIVEKHNREYEASLARRAADTTTATAEVSQIDAKKALRSPAAEGEHGTSVVTSTALEKDLLLSEDLQNTRGISRAMSSSKGEHLSPVAQVATATKDLKTSDQDSVEPIEREQPVRGTETKTFF